MSCIFGGKAFKDFFVHPPSLQHENKAHSTPSTCRSTAGFIQLFASCWFFTKKQHEIRLYLFKPRVSLLCIVSMNTLIELDSTITGDKIPPFYPFFFSATSHCCCSQQSAADDIFRDITDIFICHQTRSFTHLKGRLLTHSVTPVWVTSIRMEFCFLSWYIKLISE